MTKKIYPPPQKISLQNPLLLLQDHIFLQDSFTYVTDSVFLTKNPLLVLLIQFFLLKSSTFVYKLLPIYVITHCFFVIKTIETHIW